MKKYTLLTIIMILFTLPLLVAATQPITTSNTNLGTGISVGGDCGLITTEDSSNYNDGSNTTFAGLNCSSIASDDKQANYTHELSIQTTSQWSGNLTFVDYVALEFDLDIIPNFVQQTDIDAGGDRGSFPNRIDLGDVNNDGDEDLVIRFDCNAAGNDDLCYYERNGTKSFSTGQVIIDNHQAIGIHLTDVDNDTDTDILVADSSIGLTWLENNGSDPTSFGRHDVYVDGTNFLQGITRLGDMDNDGDVDIIGFASSNSSVFWLENPTDSTMNWTYHFIGVASNDAANEGLDIADVEPDGDLDVAYSDQSTETIHLFVNNGAQVFSKNNITTNLGGASINQIHLGDVDGDGDMDLTAMRNGPISDGTMYFFQNNNSFEWITNSLGTVGTNREQNHLFDVDLDGDLDPIGCNSGSSGNCEWWENDGTSVPSFTERVLISIEDTSEGFFLFMEDIDGDSAQEIIAGVTDTGGGGGADDEIRFYEAEDLAILNNATCNYDISINNTNSGQYENFASVSTTNRTEFNNLFTTGTPIDYLNSENEIVLRHRLHIETGSSDYSACYIGNDFIPLFDAPTNPLCGNGIIELGETCDDGSENGDPLKCNLSCDGITTPVCGNNIIESGETCDDGGTTPGDGCSATCQTEGSGDNASPMFEQEAITSPVRFADDIDFNITITDNVQLASYQLFTNVSGGPLVLSASGSITGNNVSVSESVANGLTKGNVLGWVYVAFDSEGNSNSTPDFLAVVQNQPPILTNVSITDRPPTLGQTSTGHFVATDPDTDSIDSSDLLWYVNGTIEPSSINSTTLSSTFAVDGTDVRFSVNSRDTEGANSGFSNSSLLVFGDTTPPNATDTGTNGTGGEGSTEIDNPITLSCSVFEAEGEVESVIAEVENPNQVKINLSMTLVSGNLSTGTWETTFTPNVAGTHTYVCYVTDGNGNTYTTDETPEEETFESTVPSTGGGGGGGGESTTTTILQGNATPILSFGTTQIDFFVLTTPDTVEKVVRFENVGNADFLNGELTMVGDIATLVSAEVCDLNFEGCTTTDIDLEQGESAFLVLSGIFPERTVSGIEGVAKFDGNIVTELPVIVSRPPLYERVALPIANFLGISDTLALSVSFLLLILLIIIMAFVLRSI